MSIVPTVLTSPKASVAPQEPATAVSGAASHSLPKPLLVRLAVTGLVLSITLVLFWQTVWLIGNTWYSSRTFSHGFLIVPIFLYLLWIRRERLVGVVPEPKYSLLPILAMVTLIWLLGNLADVRVVQELALVAMLETMTWILLGTAVVRALWFPLAFLFFAVPFGEAAIGPLQDFTAHFAVTALKISRVPVILENRTIWVPSGPWVVAEACSGIRYLISSLVLGLVYASLVYRSRKRRVVFVVASVVVPVIANGLRAYGIILLAYLTDNRLAVGVDHIIYGWIFFTLVQFLLFTVGLRWREWQFDAHRVLPGEAASPTVAPLPKAFAITSLCALSLVSFGPTAAHFAAKTATLESASQLTLSVSSDWQQVSSFDHGWAPLVHPVSEFNVSYVRGGDRVDTYMARYSGQHGVELARGDNQISHSQTWSQNAGGFRKVIIGGQATNVRWDEIQSASTSRLVWTWYCVGNKATANPIEVKLLQGEARLLGRPAASALVSIGTDYVLDPSVAATRLQDFLRHTSIAFSTSSITQ